MDSYVSYWPTFVKWGILVTIYYSQIAVKQKADYDTRIMTS